MTSPDAEPDLLGALDVVEKSTEEVWSSASRLAELAFSLRQALDRRIQDLALADEELATRRAAIEEELRVATHEAAASMEELRREIEHEQQVVAELHRQQSALTNELGELGALKELVLEQVARAREQLQHVLPAMDDLLRADETLQSVMTAFAPQAEQEPVDADDDDLVGRPIGRIMDLEDQA